MNDDDAQSQLRKVLREQPHGYVQPAPDVVSRESYEQMHCLRDGWRDLYRETLARAIRAEAALDSLRAREKDAGK